MAEVTEIIALIVILVLAVLSAFFGKQYRYAMEGLSKLRTTTGKIHELISTIEDALADRKLTKEEASKIIERIHALVEEGEG